MLAAKTPTSGRYYRPELDVLRCFAFLMVFVHHALILSSNSVVRQFALAGATGVQLFFLLSSFLITELLLREREATQTIQLRAFYVRRMLRIWPLYFAFLGLTIVLYRVFHFGLVTWGMVAAFVLLSGNWYVHFNGWLLSVAGPLWSISVEEQFYLLWPFILRLGYRRAAWGFSFLFLTSATVALLLAGHLPLHRYAFWSNSFIEFEFFAVGAILALVLHHRDLTCPTWVRMLYGMAGFGLLLTAAFHFHIAADTIFKRSDLLFGFALLGLGLACIFRSVLGVSLPRAANPFVSLGKISYGLYVFHVGCISATSKMVTKLHLGPPLNRNIWLITGVGLLFTVVTAKVSYHLFERPFLLLKRRFTVIESRID